MFEYGQADATAIQKSHHLLSHLNPDWLYLSGTGYTQAALEKRPLNGCSGSVVYIYSNCVGLYGLNNKLSPYLQLGQFAFVTVLI